MHEPIFRPPENPKIIQFPSTGYIRLKQLRIFVDVSKSKLLGWVRNNQFPKPYRLDIGITAWKAEEVLEWINRPRKSIE